jgi:hypothetical protein
MPAHDDNEIASLRARLNELESERSTLTARLEGLQFKAGAGSSLNSASVALNGESRAAEKIALFLRLFAGRMDILFVGRIAKSESPAMLLPVRMSGCPGCVVSHK